MHVSGLQDIGTAESLGRPTGLRKSFGGNYKPADIIEIVKKSGLRGRGGRPVSDGMK